MERDTLLPAPKVDIIDDGEEVPPTLEGIAAALGRTNGQLAEFREQLRTVIVDSKIAGDNASRALDCVINLAADTSQLRGIVGNVHTMLNLAAETTKKNNGLTGCLVIVADDEPSVLKVIESAIRSRGATTVLTCSNAAEARDLFRHVDPCIVIIDLSLGNRLAFDGLALAEEVAVSKNSGVIISSGYFLDARGHSDLRVNRRMTAINAVILPKPHTLDTISAAALEARKRYERNTELAGRRR